MIDKNNKKKGRNKAKITDIDKIYLLIPKIGAKTSYRRSRARHDNVMSVKYIF